MSLFSFHSTTALASALCALPGFCQSAPPLKLAEAATPAFSTPTLSYTSTFATYRPFGDAMLLPWRQANEAVYKAGGWRAYAKESQAAPEAPAPAPPNKTQPATPAATTGAKP